MTTIILDKEEVKQAIKDYLGRKYNVWKIEDSLTSMESDVCDIPSITIKFDSRKINREMKK